MADTNCIKAQYAGGLLGVCTDDTHFPYFMESRSSLFLLLKSSKRGLHHGSFFLHSMVVGIMLHLRNSHWVTMGGYNDG